MPKTIKKCFYSKLTFEKMLEAHNRASKGKKGKKEVNLFEMNLETNIVKILDDIRNGKYRFGEYREFVIYEPKKRIIKSLPYRDRVVHQWYIEEFIKPYFMKVFINETYACLDEKGTHKAVYNVQKQMRVAKNIYGSDYYVLKTDIKKYFYSIDKSILMNILKKRISDKRLLEFSYLILDDGTNIGIPIGNYTSQFFANIYLNELDHYVKDELKIKLYTRYMDDQIFLLKNKEEAKKVFLQVEKYITEKLNLRLNKKSKYFPNKKGIDFCGYVIFPTHIKLRKRFKNKLKKNINLWVKLKSKSRLNEEKFYLSYNSFKAHGLHSNSYNFFNKIDELLKNKNLR